MVAMVAVVAMVAFPGRCLQVPATLGPLGPASLPRWAPGGGGPSPGDTPHTSTGTVPTQHLLLPMSSFEPHQQHLLFSNPPQDLLGVPRTMATTCQDGHEGADTVSVLPHPIHSAPAPSLPTWLHPGAQPALLPARSSLLPAAQGSQDNGWRDQESWWGQRSHCRQHRGHGGERHGQRLPSFSQAPHPAAEPAEPLAAGAVPPALCWLRAPASPSQDTGD